MKKLWLLFCPSKWQLSPQWPAAGRAHHEMTRRGITSPNRVVTKINTKPISKILSASECGCMGVYVWRKERERGRERMEPTVPFLYWRGLRGRRKKKKTFLIHTLPAQQRCLWWRGGEWVCNRILSLLLKLVLFSFLFFLSFFSLLLFLFFFLSLSHLFHLSKPMCAFSDTMK